MAFAFCLQLCDVSYVINHSDNNAWFSGELVVYNASWGPSKGFGSERLAGTCQYMHYKGPKPPIVIIICAAT